MATEQRTLDAVFQEAQTAVYRGGEHQEADFQQVQPNADADRRCQGCGSHVTAEFARVMGDNENEAHACPNCASGGELRRGAAGGHEMQKGETL